MFFWSLNACQSGLIRLILSSIESADCTIALHNRITFYFDFNRITLYLISVMGRGASGAYRRSLRFPQARNKVFSAKDSTGKEGHRPSSRMEQGRTAYKSRNDPASEDRSLRSMHIIISNGTQAEH